MADKPVTREEKYLAYLTGDYKKREVFIRIMLKRNRRGNIARRNQECSK